MKHVTITFDYEGNWGMPHDAPYDLVATTHELLDLLDRHKAKAVFFTVGKLYEEFPELIKEIHDRGHEIGLHGYRHEHLHDMSEGQIAEFTENLATASQNLLKLIGRQPVGFRAPYLMGPQFYIPRTYRILAEAGYEWISNREIRMPEEISRPDRLSWTAPLWRVHVLRQLALLLLNPTLLQHEHRGTGLGMTAHRWLLGAQAPFRRPEGLMEYPLYSPLDCDLVGLPLPTIASGERLTDYTTETLIECYERAGEYFNLNSHDWVIGTADRLTILDRVLTHITADPEASYWLPGREEARHDAS